MRFTKRRSGWLWREILGWCCVFWGTGNLGQAFDKHNQPRAVIGGRTRVVMVGYDWLRGVSSIVRAASLFIDFILCHCLGQGFVSSLHTDKDQSSSPFSNGFLVQEEE